MGCGCIKARTDNVLEMAKKESKIENKPYVIYRYEGKKTYDRKECWEKAGCPGTIIRIIYPV